MIEVSVTKHRLARDGTEIRLSVLTEAVRILIEVSVTKDMIGKRRNRNSIISTNRSCQDIEDSAGQSQTQNELSGPPNNLVG